MAGAAVAHDNTCAHAFNVLHEIRDTYADECRFAGSLGTHDHNNKRRRDDSLRRTVSQWGVLFAMRQVEVALLVLVHAAILGDTECLQYTVSSRGMRRWHRVKVHVRCSKPGLGGNNLHPAHTHPGILPLGSRFSFCGCALLPLLCLFGLVSLALVRFGARLPWPMRLIARILTRIHGVRNRVVGAGQCVDLVCGYCTAILSSAHVAPALRSKRWLSRPDPITGGTQNYSQRAHE